MFNSKKISAIAFAVTLSISVALDPPYNVFADGVLTPDTTTGTDVPAIVWTWSDDNVSSGTCADGSAALLDCEGNQFCNDEPQFTGYDCVTNNGTCLDLNGDGVVTDWLGDGYCDDGAYGLVFICEEFGFDCGDCTQTGPDPNGYCNEAPPVSCEEQGLVTCPDGSCAADLNKFHAASTRGISKGGRSATMIHTGFAGQDHSIHSQLAESGDLKALFFRL